MNILNLGNHNVSIPLHGMRIQIGNYFYENPVAICKLLNVKQLEKINNWDTLEAKSKEYLEDAILEECFICFAGLHDHKVDWEILDAGVVKTITSAIVLHSFAITNTLIDTVNNVSQSLNVLHQLQAIVSRFMSTPFDQVQLLPVNELVRRYAICLQAFPLEVKPITTPEETEDDTAGD